MDTVAAASSLGADVPGRVTPSARVVRIVSWVACLGILLTVYFALIYAPTERTEGDVQRLMYLHVPAAITMYVAYAILFVASLLYLLQRKSSWDEVGASAAEVAIVFATVVLTTGPVWAKPVWGTWWTWDARLTSTLVLWLILAAYLMLRAYGGDAEQRARYCAVLAIFGFLDLPIIHYSVRWWRTLHPDPKLMTEGGVGSGLPPSMLAALAVGMVGALTLFAALFTLRLRLERLDRRTAHLRTTVQRREDLPR